MFNSTIALLITLCIVGYADSAGVMFSYETIPVANWVELATSNNVESIMASFKLTCANASIKTGDECDGYELHSDGSCTLGKLEADGDNNYIPEYLMSGKRVFLRELKVRRKAVTGVHHLASIGAGSTFDTAFEDTRFGPIDLPAPLPGGEPIIATNWGGGFLSCGGVDENDNDSKKCRYVKNCAK